LVAGQILSAFLIAWFFNAWTAARNNQNLRPVAAFRQ
jgi:hypothetical protein